jgi:hypothetical protein
MIATGGPMGCGSRPWARAKPLAARYITHSKFNRAKRRVFGVIGMQSGDWRRRAHNGFMLKWKPILGAGSGDVSTK